MGLRTPPPWILYLGTPPHGFFICSPLLEPYIHEPLGAIIFILEPSEFPCKPLPIKLLSSWREEVYPKHSVQKYLGNLRNWWRHIITARLKILSFHAGPADLAFFELAREGVPQTTCSKQFCIFASLAMTDKHGQAESVEYPCRLCQFNIFRTGPRRSVPNTLFKTFLQFCEFGDDTLKLPGWKH